MKIIRGIAHIKRYRYPVVAMGVFDGVHRAHQRILQCAVRKARACKGTSIALTFWPHPQKEDSICSLEHRLRLISELGIEVSVVIQFNKCFSRIRAEDFIEDILVRKIGSRAVLIGDNFTFGRNARGDVRLLMQESRGRYQLIVFPAIKQSQVLISSTFIRQLIVRGDILAAQKLLGRPVSIFGEVIRGSAFGRILGFPTANINPHHEVLPPAGIYAVKVSLGDKRLKGVCYIGKKPAFVTHHSSPVSRYANNIEVHLFNFHRSIYEKYLEIKFIRKIRNARRFSTPSSLIKQIKKDITKVHSLFSP